MTEKIVNGIKIHHYSCVDSTNIIALEDRGALHLTTVIADRQTGGKGRMGRHFFSYDGGLYMSVVLKTSKIKVPYHICTPVAALAVMKTLEEYRIRDIKIKWVNDLLVDGRKVCGILTESRSALDGIDRIVIGIGINLTLPQGGFPEYIKDRAGCVGYKGDKVALAAKIARNIDKYIKGDKCEIVQEYEKNMAWIGNKATVTDYSNDNQKIEGTLMGVNQDCFLKIRLTDGNERLLSSGEII